MTRLALALVLLLLLAASCARTPVRTRAPVAPESIAGLWALADGSTTIMRVVEETGRVTVEAWTRDEVRFEVSEVTWDGRRLRATFRYPPTGVTTSSDLLLLSRDRLEGLVSGDYGGRETWVRAAP